jgi:hypothetical protein
LDHFGRFFVKIFLVTLLEPKSSSAMKGIIFQKQDHHFAQVVTSCYIVTVVMSKFRLSNCQFNWIAAQTLPAILEAEVNISECIRKNYKVFPFENFLANPIRLNCSICPLKA